MNPSLFTTLAEEPLMNHVVPHNVFSSPILHLPAAKLFGFGFGDTDGNVYITNHLLMMLAAGLLMLLIFPWMAAKSKKSPVPTGLQNFFEAIMSFLRTEVFRPALGPNTDRFVPFLWTVFFFILFCNLIGLIPISEMLTVINYFTHGTLGGEGKSYNLTLFGGTATANVMVTAGLAITAFFMVHISGIVQQVRIAMDPTLDPHHGHHHGVMGGEAFEGADDHAHDSHDHHVSSHTPAHVDAHAHTHAHAVSAQSLGAAIPTAIAKYVWNFAPHPETGNGAFDIGLWLLLLVLELIGALVKPFSLTVRLFANMLAGHLVLAALVGLVFMSNLLLVRGAVSIPIVLGCGALSILELFVAFLQAYIFTFLSTLFIASAVAPEH